MARGAEAALWGGVIALGDRQSSSRLMQPDPVHLWEVGTGSALVRIEAQDADGVAFSPDGK